MAVFFRNPQESDEALRAAEEENENEKVQALTGASVNAGDQVTDHPPTSLDEHRDQVAEGLAPTGPRRRRDTVTSRKEMPPMLTRVSSLV
jgi:hypothetical protein